MASLEWWVLSFSEELVEPDGKPPFCQLIEIISLTNYLQLLGNQLSPAHVMPSGNAQSLAINDWLSAQQEDFGLFICWFANQRSRQMLLLLGLVVWNKACLHLRAALLCGALQLPPASYPPSCAWKAGCVHSWIKHGWVAPPFHLRLFRFGVVQGAWGMQRLAPIVGWYQTPLQAVWKLQEKLCPEH